MTPEQSVATATWVLGGVTAALVLVTILLVLDGWRKSREQSRRWDDEDKRRIDEAKPSAIVEIAAKEEAPLDMCFACFNLGNNTFFVDKMIVTASDGMRHESNLSPQVVTPGKWVTIDFDPAVLLGWFGEENQFKDAQCVLMLKGATGIVPTPPELFYISYGKGRADWHKGRIADRLPGVIPEQHKILRGLPKMEG
jgi:hypothetical protein